MGERTTFEGTNLGETLSAAVSQLGAMSIEEIGYEFDKEHFRRGAHTVKLDAWLRDASELEALRASRAAADTAAAWVTELLDKMGSEGTVSARMSGKMVHVQVLSKSDASLLIGREGKNIRAFQLLLTAALAKAGTPVEVKLDVESMDRPDRDDDRGRGRGRDRDRDRGDRGDRGGRGRGRDRDRGGDRGARGRDRGDRGDRPPREDRPPRDDRMRDEEIQKVAREAAKKVLDGSEESVVLGSMNSYERHVAHSTIKEIDGVRSRSVGRGDRKKVKIFLPDDD